MIRKARRGWTSRSTKNFADCRGPSVLFGLSVTLMAISGCASGSANLVRRDERGGLVAYHPGSDALFGLLSGEKKAKKLAAELMGEHCGDRGFTIMEEGEVAIGRRQESQAVGAGSRADGDSQTESVQASGSVSTSTAEKESRVRYYCGARSAEYSPPPMTLNAVGN